MTLPGLLAAPRCGRLRVGLGAAVILQLLRLGIAVLVTATGSHGKTTVVGSGRSDLGRWPDRRNPGSKVNLDTADLALLDTLPQAGPAMAKRIIDWRTADGNFTSVEDLMSVTGVGDKTFAELKDLVTV
jgi:competence protein ComEA